MNVLSSNVQVCVVRLQSAMACWSSRKCRPEYHEHTQVYIVYAIVRYGGHGVVVAVSVVVCVEVS